MEQPKAPIPHNVFSQSQSYKLLGIKPKKEGTTELAYLDFHFPSQHRVPEEGSKSQMLVREAVLKAIVTPYLRCVVMCLFGDDELKIYIAQVKQNRLRKTELIGALVSGYEQIARNDNPKFTVSFQEKEETHMMEGNEFSKFLTNHSKDVGESEVLIINVHHDFIQGFSNLTSPSSILDLVGEVNEIPYRQFE